MMRDAIRMATVNAPVMLSAAEIDIAHTLQLHIMVIAKAMTIVITFLVRR